jgi:hypothetical protein
MVNNINVEEQNSYYTKLNNYMNEIQTNCYIFEITKLCGYSSIIFMYKDDYLIDLYDRVIKHNNVERSYFRLIIYDLNNNPIDIISLCNSQLCNSPNFITIRDFMIHYTQNQYLKPIYSSPLPCVYKIYIVDTRHEERI